MRARLGKPALLGQDLRRADLRGHVLLAMLDFAVPAQRLGIILLLLGDLSQIQPDSCLVRVIELKQPLEIEFGGPVVR